MAELKFDYKNTDREPSTAGPLNKRTAAPPAAATKKGPQAGGPVKGGSKKVSQK